MVVPIVAAAAARAAATSAARAAAANAARTSAQATIRVGAQNATRTAATGARSAAAQGEVGAIRNAGGHAQNTAAERNTIQPGGRLVQSRETGGRGTQTTQEAAQKQSQDEQQSRTRDRRMRQKKTDEEVVEGGEEEPRKKGISFATLVGMLIVAFIFDGLQTLTAFLVFGFITAAISYSIAFVSNILAWSIFIIWFSLCGISIFRGRRAVVAILGFVADTALAGIVPYWIATVLVAYFDEKLEQKGVGVSKVVSMLK